MSATLEDVDESFDSELADSLEELYLGADGSLVDGEIVSVERRTSMKADDILVEIRPPICDAFTKRYRVPRDLTDEWEFNRFIRSIGYEPNAARMMIGETVTITYDRESKEWDVVIPKSRRTRCREWIADRMPSLTWIPPNVGLFLLGMFPAIPIFTWIFSFDSNVKTKIKYLCRGYTTAVLMVLFWTTLLLVIMGEITLTL